MRHRTPGMQGMATAAPDAQTVHLDDALRPFEVRVIRLMAEGCLTEDQFRAVFSAQSLSSYEYTGSGYFLSVEHPSLPEAEQTLSEPAVVGNAGDIQAGFVVFLGNGKLTL